MSRQRPKPPTAPAPPASQPLDSTIPAVQAPDVETDRVLGADAKPGDQRGAPRTPALRIHDIETLEDDAKGG